jgi:two-component system nitrogen regulation response regulator GlnG
LLVHFYLKRFNAELGREVREADPQAMDQLRRYRWPGNVRELQSVLKQALLRARGKILLPVFLPDIAEPATAATDAAAAEDGAKFDFDSFILQRLHEGSNSLHGEAHDQLDRVLLARTLRFVQGNQLHAAKILGIARQTLRNRLRGLGLSITKGVEGGGE